MNPIALYLASGESLYTGAIILLLTLLVSPFIQNKWLLRLRNLAAWIGVAMFLLACAPFAWPIYAGFIAIFLSWFIAWNLSTKNDSRAKRLTRATSSAILAVSLLVLPAIELPYRNAPILTGPHHDHLVIVGDSISAGIEAGYDPWPNVFTKRTNIPVKNLARPGIGTDEAIDLAKKATPDDTLILLEIGGNDLLSNLPAADFDRQLTHLITMLDQPNRTLIMFELPLLPHKIEYGSIQRRLAAEYHIALIPKRFFIDIIGSADATSDGLHLSRSGAQHMAVFIAHLLNPILTPPATTTSQPTITTRP